MSAAIDRTVGRGALSLRSAKHGGLWRIVGVLLSLHLPGPVVLDEASGFEPVWEIPAFQDEERPVGLRGILDNRGRHVHNVGNVLSNITNFGVIGSMPWSGQSFDTAASMQWPAGSGVEHLFGGGLWVGAERNGERVVTATEIRQGQLLLEFYPGTDARQRIYESKEHQERGQRPPSAHADDDGDGTMDEDWPDGYDNDGDGLVDEDFAAVSDQMFTCEYNDDDPRILLWAPEHRALGIHVRQTTMAWSAQGIADFIGMHFEITNRGPDTLRDVYLGFFADFDIGPLDLSASSQDDMVGFWEGSYELLTETGERTVDLSVAYMFDADGDEGRSPGHVGIVFLGKREVRPILSAPVLRFPMEVEAPVHNFQAYSRFSSNTHGGKPVNDEDRYALLAGTTPYALGDDRRPSVSTAPNDYSVVLSAAPLEVLEPGQQVSLKMALVVGGSLEEMLAHAAQAKILHDGQWFDVDGDPNTGVGGRELRICGPEYADTKLNLDCCPFAIPRLPKECKGSVPVDGCIWTNGDCRQTGTGGRETQVLWTGEQPPPAPNMRLVGHEKYIELYWDNRSETISDPLSGVIDFESYRIWRADNWVRPLGTTRRTGPGPDAWLLMAEYDLPGNGIGWDSGLDDIRYEPNLPEGAVSFYRDWFREYPGQPPPGIPGLSEAACDTAQAMARGVRYYRFVDPPFVRNGAIGGPCPPRGPCPPLHTPNGMTPSRCNDAGFCAQVTAPPKSGTHVFYAITATDHRLERRNGELVATGNGLVGGPNTNFEYISPPTDPLDPTSGSGSSIYVVPNPATSESMQPWSLGPTHDDPSGLKIEFHYLPRGRGQVSIYTLSGDLVIELPFDTRGGNGSLPWNLVSRNGQEVTSGVYLYVVQADTPGFEKFISRFVVIR